MLPAGPIFLLPSPSLFPLTGRTLPLVLVSYLAFLKHWHSSTGRLKRRERFPAPECRKRVPSQLCQVRNPRRASIRQTRRTHRIYFLRSGYPGDRQQLFIAPIVARLCRGTGKCP
jgi:hypothetical protein